MRLDLADPDHPKTGKPELFLSSPGADVEPAFSRMGSGSPTPAMSRVRIKSPCAHFRKGAQGAGQAQISSAAGRFPLWSRTSKEIFYLTPEGHILVAPYVVNGRAFLPGKPELWSDAIIGGTGNSTPYDIAPDGKRFVVFPGLENTAGDKANLDVTFLVNFFDELKRRMP